MYVCVTTCVMSQWLTYDVCGVDTFTRRRHSLKTHYKLSMTIGLVIGNLRTVPDTSFNNNPNNGFKRRNPDHWPHQQTN